MKKKTTSTKHLTGDGTGTALPPFDPSEEQTAPARLLDPGQLAAAERIEPAYRHPESARTVAYHHDGHAYTITGLPAGKAAAST